MKRRWSDTMLWQIHPHYKTQVAALLDNIKQGDGLHRDNIERKFTKVVATWMDMDELPIDLEDNGIAIVTVSGPLIKEWNYYTASYRALTEAFRKLRNSQDVLAVVVKFDTPGGTVDGLDECANALKELAATKLTVAQIDGGCYSAGYFLACACPTICCGRTMHVGNIGTVISLVDYSEAFKSRGLRSVTKKTGEIKGIGIEGDEITQAQEEFLQSLVDQHFAHFQAAVIEGREMSDEQFAAVSDGSWWLGESALGLKLIDQVATLEQTLQMVRDQTIAKGAI
jgi:signal peptide peptidase SppA